MNEAFDAWRNGFFFLSFFLGDGSARSFIKQVMQIQKPPSRRECEVTGVLESAKVSSVYV
jgi:hypothetical protein